MSGAAIEFRDVVVNAAPSRHSGEGVAASGHILNGISLQLKAGTTTALLGRSGSGKTTLLRTINGLVLPTSGVVLVDGQLVGASDLLMLRRGIGYVIQETGLYPHLSILRNVAMPLEIAGRPKAERESRACEVLSLTGLDPATFANRMPWQLSGGQRQRAGVARALAAAPSILLLDEPFGALDPLTRAEMQTMLRDLLARLGKTAVIVTHDLQEALFLADRILLVEKGSIAADLPSSQVLQSQLAAVQEYVAAVHRIPEAQP
jgi:osmoprotectant transport system ATP-binding protein